MPPSPRLFALARAGVFGTGALLASVTAAQPAAAQPAAGPPAGVAAVSTPAADSLFSLADALRAALEFSPALRVARQQVRVGHGGVITAESPFDPVVRTTVSSNQTSDLEFGVPTAGDPLAANSVINTRERVVDYQVGVAQQLRNGLTITPTLGVQQATIAGLSTAPSNRATASLNVVVPLARNRMGGAVAASRRAAIAGYDATRADLRQAAAQTTLDAATAYWDYAAAGERLAAYRSSEQRARVMVDETAELVRADERPAADIRQVRGNLASKRAQRIAAEQTLAEARQRLGIVLGLPAQQIATISSARLAAVPNTGAAPPDDRADADEVRRAAAWARSVASAALARRADVRAAAARREAAAQSLAAADHDLRPRIDLTLGVTYAGLTQGYGVGGFVSPLGRTAPGTSSVLQLQYELPTRRLLARGVAEQAEAALEEARISERDLTRQVESAVSVAAVGVDRGRRALGEAGDAVRLSREVVDNEKQKFRLGASTQLDVLYAEDGLVTALLAEIAARRTYIGAVGTLRFAAGDLGAATTAVEGGDARTAASSLAAVLAQDPRPAVRTPAAPVSIPAPPRRAP